MSDKTTVTNVYDNKTIVIEPLRPGLPEDPVAAISADWQPLTWGEGRRTLPNAHFSAEAAEKLGIALLEAAGSNRLTPPPAWEPEVGHFAVFTGEVFKQRVGYGHGIDAGTLVKITGRKTRRPGDYNFQVEGQPERSFYGFIGDFEGPVEVNVKVTTTETWEKVS